VALSLASIGGGAMVISGFVLIFPFSNGITVSGMELTEIVHSVVGMVFIAIIVAHIYIGTLGMGARSRQWEKAPSTGDPATGCAI
jgi:cytochrome b subunit of formate dehydrogenase